MILTDEGKKEFLKSKFHQYFDITLSNQNIQENNVDQFVNFVLPLNKLNEYYDMNSFKKFFNNDFTNVIFTPSDNQDIIYNYEFYKNVYFVRLKPFSKRIRMHIIPKKYDASDSSTHPVLFFKDDRQEINSLTFEHTNEYERDSEGVPLNLHFTPQEKKKSNGMYLFNIKKYTQNLKKIQINMGYSYIPPTDRFNKITHVTGIIDESDETGKTLDPSNLTEWNTALVDCNHDNNSTYTNTILEQKMKNHKIDWDNLQPTNGGFNNPHSINTLYHKTLKYFNDVLYTEENGQFYLANWEEIRED